MTMLSNARRWTVLGNDYSAGHVGMDRTKIIVLERLKFLDFLAALPIKEKIINLLMRVTIGEW